MSGGCPGDIWVVFIGIGGAQMGLIGYLGLALCLCWRLLSSVGISCSLEMSGDCLEIVWGVSRRYLGDIHRNRRCSDGFDWVSGFFLGS